MSSCTGDSPKQSDTLIQTQHLQKGLTALLDCKGVMWVVLESPAIPHYLSNDLGLARGISCTSAAKRGLVVL